MNALVVKIRDKSHSRHDGGKTGHVLEPLNIRLGGSSTDSDRVTGRDTTLMAGGL